MRRRIASWPGLLSLLAGLLILSLSAVPSLAQFSVESVTFKNNIPCTSISVPDRSPFGEPEWVRNGNNFPTAYVKGTDVEVDIVIRYNGFFPFVGTLTLGGSYIPISPRVGPHTLSPTPSTIPMALPPYSTTMVTTTFSGMPDVVCSGGLFIYYDFSGMPAGPTGHSVYLVYSDPQAPMTVPWVEVLANACWWASGYSTPGDVARYLTTGLFFAKRFAYPGSGASYWTIDIGPGTFDLTRYYNTPGWVSGNCEDVSDFLTICANALGLNFHVQQYTGNPLFYDPPNNQ